MTELPKGYTTRDGKVRNEFGQWVEFTEGQWLVVRDGSRDGWWRYHSHYDRDCYCDNPARGY